QGLPVYTSPSGAAAEAVSLLNFGAPVAVSRVVSRGEWVRSGGPSPDSAWLEPIDLPNTPRAIVVYVPSMRWVYSSRIGGPADVARVSAVARARGWTVDRIGSPGSPEGVAP